MRIVELPEANRLAADLFYRVYRQPIPDFPRHFVLVCERPGQDLFVLGYVHQTQFESAYLAGGLVVDAWKFRTLAETEKQEIRGRGGMGEWLMTDSCRKVQPCAAIFGYIGDAKALLVDTRVGFRPTGYPYLYVFAPPSANRDELAALTTRVAALGPF